MLLEPQGKHAVRNIHINIAGLMALILLISLGSAALAWYYTPPRTKAIPARYDKIHLKNKHMRDKIATLEGQFSLLKTQNSALKNELLASQHDVETLRHKLKLYESILDARKLKGVRILRANARMADNNTLHYKLLLVKGGNYSRPVSGSVRITAIGEANQTQVLQLGADMPERPYTMDTHIFMEGDVPWMQAWQPKAIHVTRFNAKGVKRGEMEIELNVPDTKSTGATYEKEGANETRKNHGE